jgi:prokaryotic ubiquitin-like protein Pup
MLTTQTSRSRKTRWARQALTDIAVMADQEHSTKQPDAAKTTPAPPKAETAQRRANVAEKGEKLKKDLDKIIDEIDDVLEENAEEFIRSYVQRGGE